MADIASVIVLGILATVSAAQAMPETTNVRHFVDDFKAGRYNFRLPFQRKPQWKNDAKSCWIIALLKRHLVDPLSISKPLVGPKRGINGGNRARATADYVDNKFPFVVKHGTRNHNFWFSAIPEALRGNRFHHVLSPEVREHLLETPIYLHVRVNLTLNEEIEWYHNMNKNQVPHTPGHILNGMMCKDDPEPFCVATVNTFPGVRPKYDIPSDPADIHSLGYMLETLSEVDIDIMNEDDKRDDNVASIANLTNLLACGNTYDRNGFAGILNPETLQQNIAQVREIFDGFAPSTAMLEEFKSPVKNKPYQSRFWSTSYLLGPMFYSIAKQKPDAVNVWKTFLAHCRPGLIDELYIEEIVGRSSIGSETDLRRYMLAWERVDAYVATLNRA